jgi:PilZ domain
VEGSVSTSSLPRIERRLKARYPVQLPARYRSLDRERVAGVGLTVNISSNGLLVTCQHEIQLGTRMEVLINWPSLLESTIPLQLVTTGRVIRSGASTFVIEFAQYQFRTMKSKPLEGPLQFGRSATA